MKQADIVIKTLFHGFYEVEINETIDTFCTEYNAFNNKNVSFDSNDFCSSKYI